MHGEDDRVCVHAYYMRACACTHTSMRASMLTLSLHERPYIQPYMPDMPSYPCPHARFSASMLPCWHACLHACSYDEDLALAASLGCTSFRLSLEWARLQPAGPGTPLDSHAVARYGTTLCING